MGDGLVAGSDLFLQGLPELAGLADAQLVHVMGRAVAFCREGGEQLLAAGGEFGQLGLVGRGADLREAQLLTARSVPRVALAVTLDAGEDHIHPRNKRPVGERLAGLALARVYGQSLVSSSPLYAGYAIEGDTVRVRFTECGTGLCPLDGARLRGFVLAGVDRKFVPAEATIAGDVVIVRSDRVAAPVAVRYAWAEFPDCNLGHREGVPASPFRSDSWPESTFGLK